MPPNGCAMISYSPGYRAEFCLVLRESWRSTLMTAADRSTRSFRALLFLIVSFGLPNLAVAATLEDSAKELAQKIAVALPARENVSFEIQNSSFLHPEEVSRVEQALKAELQERGVVLSSIIGAPITVVVTLSENFKNLVWTGEIQYGGASYLVLVAAERSTENRAFSRAMPVTIRSEKLWEGPQRILDAGEVPDGRGHSWLLLLTPNGLVIRDSQSGSASVVEITSAQSASREPQGILRPGQTESTAELFLAPQSCTVDLTTRSLIECQPGQAPFRGPLAGRLPVSTDHLSPGPPPPGIGEELPVGRGCGDSDQFLGTGARDYTQTDAVHVFQTTSGIPIATSTELDFPGPILAFHNALGAPTAIVRNLTTGNYEAYRLSFSCGQ